MPISQAYLQARITATEAAIAAYEAAQLALGVAGGVQSYSLDTGQSKQTVTRADLGTIQKTIDSLYNQLATLCARKDGASSIGRPGW